MRPTLLNIAPKKRKQTASGGSFDNGLYERLTQKPRLVFSPYYQINPAVVNAGEIERASDGVTKLIPFCNGILQKNAIDSFLTTNAGRWKKINGQGQYRYNFEEPTDVNRPLAWDGATQDLYKDPNGNYTTESSLTAGPSTGIGVSATSDAARDLRTVDPCFGLGIDQIYSFFFVFEVTHVPAAGESVNLLSHNFQSNCPGVQPILYNLSGTHQFICRVDDGPNVTYIRINAPVNFQLGDIIVWEGYINPLSAQANTTGTSFVLSGSSIGSRVTFSDGDFTTGGAGSVAQSTDYRVRIGLTRATNMTVSSSFFADFVGEMTSGDISRMRSWIDATFFGDNPSTEATYPQTCTAPIADNQELIDYLSEVSAHTGTAAGITTQNLMNDFFQDCKQLGLLTADLLNVYIGTQDGDMVAREVGLTNPTGPKLSINLLSTSNNGFVFGDVADRVQSPYIPSTVGINSLGVLVIFSGDTSQVACLVGAKDGSGEFSIKLGSGQTIYFANAAQNTIAQQLQEGTTYLCRDANNSVIYVNNAEVLDDSTEASTGAPAVVMDIGSLNNAGSKESALSSGTIKAVAFFNGAYLPKAPLLASALIEYITQYEA